MLSVEYGRGAGSMCPFYRYSAVRVDMELATRYGRAQRVRRTFLALFHGSRAFARVCVFRGYLDGFKFDGTELMANRHTLERRFSTQLYQLATTWTSFRRHRGTRNLTVAAKRLDLGSDVGGQLRTRYSRARR